LRFDGRPVEEPVLRRLGERIAHRGPDDEGTFAGTSVGLAHRRLSILDLSAAARQPMWDAGRTAALCYNGEVYNYRVLRDQLTRDRTGIKPLYYHRDPERVIFASEIKALLGEVEARPDESSLLALLMQVPLHDPHTLFEGVRAVEAGQAVRVRPSGRWEPHTF